MHALEPVRRTPEIEDPTNLHVVHPIANRLLPVCVRLGVTPNAVSLAGMGCGLLAGLAYAHDRSPAAVVAGLLLMLAWHVMDGVDGQLARLTNAQSHTGKILDGICDYVTFAAVYLALAAVEGHRQGGWVWGLVALSGACHAVQSAIYEVQRQEYDHWGHGRAGAALPDPSAAGPGLMDRLHAPYLALQRLAVPLHGDARQRLEALLQADPAGVRARYRACFAPAVRRWSVLSANVRTLGLFACTLLRHPLLFFVLEIVGGSAVLAVLLLRQRSRVRRFIRPGLCPGPAKGRGPLEPFL